MVILLLWQKSPQSGVPQGSILGPLDVNINILRVQTCNYGQQFLDCLQSYVLNSLPSNKPLELFSLPVRILIGACQILAKPLLIFLTKYNLVISATAGTQSFLTPVSFLTNTSKSAFFSKITIFHCSGTNNNISQFSNTVYNIEKNGNNENWILFIITKYPLGEPAGCGQNVG